MGSKAKIKLDKESVYLEIEDLSDCCFEFWETETGKSRTVMMKMPVKTWKKIIKSWNNEKNKIISTN